MWTDVETAEDLIGFRVHADLIRGVVTDSSLLPVTIGVFGDWGGGKTSIMKMLERDLDPDTTTDAANKDRYERVACLYINGWLFEGYDDAKAALLSAVLVALGEHKRFGPKAREKVASLLNSVNWMRVARLGMKEVAIPAIAAYASGGASLIPSGLAALGRITSSVLGKSDAKEVKDDESPKGDDQHVGGDKKEESDGIDWESLLRKDKRAASPLDVRTFRERFASLLKDTDIDTLVVLIDDLDRCSPERIVDNLEAIKLFLNVPRTAFVIGADPRIVRHAIAVRYRTASVERDAATPSAVVDPGAGESADAEERLITDYLEKLIQVPYWLPRLSPAEIETYMALLFCRRDLAPERWQVCLGASASQRVANRYGTFGYAAVRQALGGTEVEPASLVSGLMFSANVAPLITEGLKGNPRQVKRFLNAFSLRRKLANVANLTNVRDDVLVKLMILEYTRPKEFRQLFEWQASQSGFPIEIRSMEASYSGSATGAESRSPAVPAAAEAVRPARERSEPDPETRETRKGSSSVSARGEGNMRSGARPMSDPSTTVLPWTGDFLKRWIAMAPSLSDVDLRDYFWIARDRLATTFSGLSLVPPIVRRVFEDLISGNPGRRASAVVTAASMDDTERTALLELLTVQLTRQPDQKVGYDAYRALIEREVTGSASALAAAATSVPVARVPAGVGPDLRALISARAAVATDLQPLLDRWSQAVDTQVGRALTVRPASGAARSPRPPRQ